MESAFKRFLESLGLSLCFGVIDGSTFHKYKGTFSIFPMAVVDASYIFTYVGVLDYGRQCDSSVFNNTKFVELLNKGNLNLPQDECSPNMLAKARYCFMGDETFPLQDTLQKAIPWQKSP